MGLELCDSLSGTVVPLKIPTEELSIHSDAGSVSTSVLCPSSEACVELRALIMGIFNPCFYIPSLSESHKCPYFLLLILNFKFTWNLGVGRSLREGVLCLIPTSFI